MTFRLLASSLTAVLLAGSLGCTKRDDPAAVGTGSYVLDGQARACQATQEASTSAGFDYLTISLVTTPQPSRGAESLQLTFRKPTGQPAGSYQPVPVGSMLLATSPGASPINFQHQSPAPRLSGSTAAGTFAGEAVASLSAGIFTVIHTITAGTYTDARAK